MLLDGPERWRSIPPGPRQPHRPGDGGREALPWDEPAPGDADEPSYALPALVDQYGAGVSHGELGLGSFESHLATAVGSRGPAPPGTTFFDTWLGLAVRRWCPPLLGLEPHSTPARYLAARRALGAYRATRLLLRGSGVAAYLLAADAADEPLTAAELSSAADATAHEVVRLPALAGRVADAAGGTREFLTRLAEGLEEAARHAVAFAAPMPAAPHAEAPDGEAVRGAVDRWLRARAPGQPPDDPVLLYHLLWSAVASGLPVQLHGPAPEQAAAFLAATCGLGTDLVLLPDPGGHQPAARLAAVFPHVYADVGPAPGQTLRLAPFGKLMFSTGARALPELYVVAARQFAESMAHTVREWTDTGVCAEPEAWRIAALVAAGTAGRVYRLAAGSSAVT